MRGLGARELPSQASYVCRRCLVRQQQRTFSVSAAHRSTLSVNPPRPTDSGLASLPSRRLISVSGPDATKYLHGVITSSFATPAAAGTRERGFYSVFLNAQGRVLHDVFIYPDTLGIGRGQQESWTSSSGESFLVEVDAADADRLQKHIKRYKLRAKFNVRLLERDEATVWHAWHEAGKAGLPSLPDKPQDDAILLEDTRAPHLGIRAVTTRDRRPAFDLEHAPEQAYQIRRYLRGVPEGQDEMIREQALPLESNVDVMGGIDFRKGCYVGQELTIRTKHRGVVRKRILPCVLYGEEQAAPLTLEYRPTVFPEDRGPGVFGAEMVAGEMSIGRVGRKGRSAGKWLRGIGNVGLALCRLEAMTDMVMPGETAAAAYSPEDEFVLQDKSRAEDHHVGQTIKVKAFVPDWLRRGLEQSEQSH